MATMHAPGSSPARKPARAAAVPRKRVLVARRTPQPARQDLDELVLFVSQATPFELVHLERSGVEGRILKDLSRRLELSQLHVFDMLGVPKATAEKKVAAGEVLSGSGGQAAIGMVKLIAKAGEIVANSTAPEARGFDAAKWLGKWIELPQPALGGRRPSELLDTPTGLEVVLKVLGAIESGAYQ